MERDKKGKFEKGNPGKQPGTTRKVTRLTQEAMSAALEGSSEKIQEALNYVYESDKHAFLHVIAKFLPFVIAKKSDITSNGQTIAHSPLDLSLLTDEELDTLQRIAGKATKPGADRSGEV